MKRKISKALCAFMPVLFVMLTCSCTFFDVFAVDSLIRAPKLTGENAAIQQAFENAAGKDISLVNPLFGDYRSAFVLYDYDKDGIGEAIVFYSKKDSPDEVRLNVLDHGPDGWCSVCDAAGNGSEVYKIDFVNLDKDGDAEIAVTWTLSDSKRTKTLSLYKLVSSSGGVPEKTLNQLAAVQMVEYMVADIDFDGQNEVFYIYSSLSGNSTLYYAALFKMDTITLSPVPLSEVGISWDIEQIVGFMNDIKDAKYTFYIDCLCGDGRYFTEIICYDYANNALVRPVNEEGNYLSAGTYRYDPIFCSDINGDYMTDIPAQTEYEGSYYKDDDTSAEAPLYLTSYYQFVEGELICTAKYYRNNYCGFSIRTDDFWESTYVVYNVVTGSTQFRMKNCEEADDLLFTLSVNEKDESDERFYIGVTALGEQNNFTEEKIASLIEAI